MHVVSVKTMTARQTDIGKITKLRRRDEMREGGEETGAEQQRILKKSHSHSVRLAFEMEKTFSHGNRAFVYPQ